MLLTNAIITHSLNYFFLHFGLIASIKIIYNAFFNYTFQVTYVKRILLRTHNNYPVTVQLGAIV